MRRERSLTYRYANKSAVLTRSTSSRAARRCSRRVNSWLCYHTKYYFMKYWATELESIHPTGQLADPLFCAYVRREISD